MMDIEKLEPHRAKGIVWVCDVIGSSKYLNDNESAGEVEEFLFRLYWLSAFVVRAAGGLLIKGTGDGFLAWFETPLYREAQEKARSVFLAATQLSLLVLITQLGLSPKRRFEIRHSVTYEHDALITRIKHLGGYESLDILGRAVVLAFRLSGIPAKYPYIITQGDLVSDVDTKRYELFKFEKLAFKPNDILRYFKGERWGTKSIFKLVISRWNSKDISHLSAIESNLSNEQELLEIIKNAMGVDILFIERLFKSIESGPEWCKGVRDKYITSIIEVISEPLRIVRGGKQKSNNELIKELKRYSVKLRQELNIE